MKKLIAVFLVIVCLWSFAATAFSAGNIQYFGGVREEMCDADYWAKKAENPDQVLMTSAQIDGYNKAAEAAKDTYRVNLFEIERSYDATALQNSLLKGTENEKPSRTLFIDGQQLDKDAFYEEILSSMRSTGWQGDRLFSYAICTTHTGIYGIPTDLPIGYSATDPDSEFQLSELRVNEPFLIKQACTFRGKTFYWGLSSHLSGWVDAEHLAICSDRQTWKDAFQVKTSAKDYIVVTADQVMTEPSRTVPSTSRVRLTLGTVLKLVEAENIPQNIGERNAWNSYVVYLPTRNADGSYKKQMALLPQHSDVSVGYLTLTQENLLQIAFKCLGNAYGWAGTMGAMDCSLYTRAVYRCFGLDLPRNTTWQQNVPNTKIDLSGKTNKEKTAIFSKLPAGTMLYFPGHTMLYLGMDNGIGYVISDTGTVIPPDGELKVESTYSVIINPLSARRRSGNTWLSELTAAVLPSEYNGHVKQVTVKKATPDKNGSRVVTCTICGQTVSETVIASPKRIKLSSARFVYNDSAVTPQVKVIDANGKTIDAKYYKVKYSGNRKIGTATVTVRFKGLYSGTLTRNFKIVPKGTAIMSVQNAGSKLIVTWKRQTKETTGYELTVAKNAAFTKGVKTIKIGDPKQNYAIVEGVKGSVCYLRVRTLHKENKHTVSSDWSKTTKYTRPK